MSSAGSSLLGAAIGAFSLVASSVTAAGEDASATDTVFLVDSSGSNFRSDPGGARSFGPQERPVRERGLSLVDLIVALRDYDERLAHDEYYVENWSPWLDAWILVLTLFKGFRNAI